MFGKPALDRENTYKRDTLGIYRSILGLPMQVQTTWEGILQTPIPDDYRHIDNVVVAGMGGSALGARVIRSWAETQMRTPLTIVTDYTLPSFVGPDTLVILSSYSGTTEETLSAAEVAQSRGAKIFCLSAGGQLEKIARSLGWPAYFFSLEHNPSNQPRMAIGINTIAIAAILAKLNLIDLGAEQIMQTVNLLQEQQKALGKEVPSKTNFAKKLAIKASNQGLVIVSGRHLRGAAHVVKNQLNENAKTFAARFDIPEMNHHLLEGLSNPKQLKNDLHFILLDSLLYPAVIRKRMQITHEILSKLGYSTTVVRTESDSAWLQLWETIGFGEYVSFYLALLHKLDPGPIQWVDYFKRQMVA